MKATKATKAAKKVATKKITKKQKVYIAMILDSSGSMDIIRTQARNHFNEQLQTAKEFADTKDVRIFLTTFSTTPEIKLFDVAIDQANQLEEKDYLPNGTTALYDAIGLTVERMEKEIKDLKKDNVSVLVNVITDGEENASTDYTQQKIKEKVDSLTATKKWTFAYMGANHDVLSAAGRLGIVAGNTAVFSSTAVGMNHATCRLRGATSNYLGSIGAGGSGMNVQNFYDDPKASTAK